MKIAWAVRNVGPKSVQDDLRSQQYRLMQVKDRTPMTQEAMRLQQAQERTAHWRRWGPMPCGWGTTSGNAWVELWERSLSAISGTQRLPRNNQWL